MAEFAKVHVDMNERRFLDLLTKLIGETEFLQNNPSGGLIPKEDLASDHVMKLIAPYATENGPLEMERITFVEGRGNLIIKYPSVTGGDKVCSFVGSHLDGENVITVFLFQKKSKSKSISIAFSRSSGPKRLG